MLSPEGRKDGREEGKEGSGVEDNGNSFSKERGKDDLSAFQSPPACDRDRPFNPPTARVRPRPVPPAQDILPKTTSEASASALPYVAPVLPLPTAVSRGPAASLLSNLEIRDDKEDGRASKSYLSSLPLHPSESNILSPKTPSQQK